ncbi:hypothetical protein [Streptomyces sp. Wh19]|uniref:hypothetical protein n=1 Tax=Streptomyces sp. Wh19 TaxID=3076629 RepID=UPI0029586791|nr:hypothetical protein [Streptomyces sp. Wh19]MDV9200157.1 hypothetical protein [Streptomyces sp. Wh19]
MWRLAESAHPVLTDEGGAILDERTGRWTHLTLTACAALMLLFAGATMKETAGQYAERYGIDAGQARGRRPYGRGRVGRAGPRRGGPSALVGVVAVTSMEAYSTVRTGTFPERCAAAAGLALALVLLWLPFRHTVRTVAPATRLPCSGVSTRRPGSSSRRSVPALSCGRPLVAPHVALLIAPGSVVIGGEPRIAGAATSGPRADY